jgi:hypothetical protein
MCTRIWKIATGLMITTALEEASECLKQSKILNQFISMAHSKERTNITHTATSYILFDSKELWEELPSEEIHRWIWTTPVRSLADLRQTYLLASSITGCHWLWVVLTLLVKAYGMPYLHPDSCLSDSLTEC